MFFKKWKIRRMENRRQTEVRKRLFTWIFRYLRLHSELLEDPIYKEMYDYHRAMLVAYMKRDHKNKKITDEERGKLVDVLADIFNKSSADRVNEYQFFVEELHKTWNDPPVANCR